MEVVNIPEKGRGWIATEYLKEGKVLLEEEPICSAQFRIGARKNLRRKRLFLNHNINRTMVAHFSWGRKLGYSCCFHCMLPLEEPNQCIARLTQGQIIHLPENDWSAKEFKKIDPVNCQKTG